MVDRESEVHSFSLLGLSLVVRPRLGEREGEGRVSAVEALYREKIIAAPHCARHYYGRDNCGLRLVTVRIEFELGDTTSQTFRMRYQSLQQKQTKTVMILRNFLVGTPRAPSAACISPFKILWTSGQKYGESRPTRRWDPGNRRCRLTEAWAGRRARRPQKTFTLTALSHGPRQKQRAV